MFYFVVTIEILRSVDQRTFEIRQEQAHTYHGPGTDVPHKFGKTDSSILPLLKGILFSDRYRGFFFDLLMTTLNEQPRPDKEIALPC